MISTRGTVLPLVLVVLLAVACGDATVPPTRTPPPTVTPTLVPTATTAPTPTRTADTQLRIYELALEEFNVPSPTVQ